MKKIGICENCKREMSIHAKKMCCTCYKKLFWKPELIKCKRCERLLPMRAKGFCAGCYSSLFTIEHVKQENVKNLYGIDYETYKQITTSCVICGFDKKVSMHHLDKNKLNNSRDNLVGLCPNHHMMIHDRKYQDEIISILREKGYDARQLIKIMPRQ